MRSTRAAYRLGTRCIAAAGAGGSVPLSTRGGSSNGANGSGGGAGGGCGGGGGGSGGGAGGGGNSGSGSGHGGNDGGGNHAYRFGGGAAGGGPSSSTGNSGFYTEQDGDGGTGKTAPKRPLGKEAAGSSKRKSVRFQLPGEALSDGAKGTPVVVAVDIGTTKAMVAVSTRVDQVCLPFEVLYAL